MKKGIIKFKLERGVPLRSSKSDRKYEWPFGSMKVGDSFLFPVQQDGTTALAIYSARGTVLRNARDWRETGRRFVTRLEEDRKAIRVWRTK